MGCDMNFYNSFNDLYNSNKKQDKCVFNYLFRLADGISIAPETTTLYCDVVFDKEKNPDGTYDIAYVDFKKSEANIDDVCNTIDYVLVGTSIGTLDYDKYGTITASRALSESEASEVAKALDEKFNGTWDE